jgi:hypothetical protein
MAMSFVPHALMAGFVSGAAIIIALSQMSNIMGKLYTLKHGLSCCLYHCLEIEGLVSAVTIRKSRGENN